MKLKLLNYLKITCAVILSFSILSGHALAEGTTDGFTNQENSAIIQQEQNSSSDVTSDQVVGESQPEIIPEQEQALEKSQLIDQNVVVSPPISYAMTTGITNGAVYNLRNVASGKYLNVYGGGNTNGTNVIQWTADGSNEQKFKVVYDSGSDSYRFFPLSSNGGNGKVLDIYRGSGAVAPGQNIDIWDNNDPTAQQFAIVPYNGSDVFTIRPKANQGLAVGSLYITNGTGSSNPVIQNGNVFLSTYTNNYQQWKFELVSAPGVVTGLLDSVTSTAISGWAWDNGMPNSPINVSINVYNSSGQAVLAPIIITANGFRDDLLRNGIGNGYHTFSYALNWNQLPYGQYSVRVYGLNGTTNPLLWACPQTYNHVGPVMQYNLDGVNSTSIFGWIANLTNPTQTIQVSIYIYSLYNGVETKIRQIDGVNANLYRSDLEPVVGNGNHGFTYNINWNDFASGTYIIKAYHNVGSFTPIFASPLTYVHVGNGLNNTYATATRTVWNTKTDMTIQAGVSYYYKFIPNENTTYFLKTTGTTDTVGVLNYDINTMVKYDHDSGTGSNFFMTYSLTAGNEYVIKVRGETTTTTGAYSLYIGKGTDGTIPAGSWRYMFDDANNYSKITYPYINGTHNAIDIIHKAAPNINGQNIKSVATGTVYRVQRNQYVSDYGMHIVITTNIMGPDGVHPYMVGYAHLSSIPDGIVEGSSIVQGTIIGTSGVTGNCPNGGHLHFWFTTDGRPEDYLNDLGTVNPIPFFHSVPFIYAPY